MLCEIVTPERRASGSKGRGTSSHRAQTPSDSKSNRRVTPRLCPVCGIRTKDPKRGQDSNRHILTVHLPDSICCPHPDCTWHGSRQDMFKTHIKKSEKCGAMADQFEIYNTNLALHWLINESIPFETVETYALGFVEERARELGKVDKWGPLSEWRKSKSQRKHVLAEADALTVTSQVVVENDWVEI